MKWYRKNEEKMLRDTVAMKVKVLVPHAPSQSLYFAQTNGNEQVVSPSRTADVQVCTIVDTWDNVQMCYSSSYTN